VSDIQKAGMALGYRTIQGNRTISYPQRCQELKQIELRQRNKTAFYPISQVILPSCMLEALPLLYRTDDLVNTHNQVWTNAELTAFP